jgi:DNA-directed RNA polymerase specialized sigma subunit
MRDKACIIRTPRSIFEEGEHIDCLSLDQEMKTGIPLDALCGQEDPFEQDYDKFLAIWNKLDKLVLKGIISARDLKFLHLRYEEQYDYKSIGSMYNCSAQRVAQVVDRTIQRIRPYFLDRKPI